MARYWRQTIFLAWLPRTSMILLSILFFGVFDYGIVDGSPNLIKHPAERPQANSFSLRSPCSVHSKRMALSLACREESILVRVLTADLSSSAEAFVGVEGKYLWTDRVKLEDLGVKFKMDGIIATAVFGFRF